MVASQANTHENDSENAIQNRLLVLHAVELTDFQ